MSRPTLTFVTRVGCPMCDEALPMVERIGRRFGFGVEVVDVDEEGLAERFGDRVPVVLAPAGFELLSGKFGRVQTVAKLSKLKRPSWPG